jgi:ribonuclease R
VTAHDLLNAIRSHTGGPETARGLFQRLGVDASDRATVRRLLKGLVADGSLVMVGGRRFTLPDRVDVVTGRLQGHAGGFAFVLPDTPNGVDLFIPESARAGAMHGDRVAARV